MEIKDAVAAAKQLLIDMYADEPIAHLGLEAFERGPADDWLVTLSFARAWNTPKTRAQEVLENLGAGSSLRRSVKTISLGRAGELNWMRDPVTAHGD